MQLSELLSKQMELDNYIISKKQLNITDKTRLTNTILALIVEVAEFANEVRSFKHWSDKPMSSIEVVLEEYVDALHFVLSIANQLGLDAGMIEDAYMEKWKKNFDRQDAGY